MAKYIYALLLWRISLFLLVLPSRWFYYTAVIMILQLAKHSVRTRRVGNYREPSLSVVFISFGYFSTPMSPRIRRLPLCTVLCHPAFVNTSQKACGHLRASVYRQRSRSFARRFLSVFIYFYDKIREHIWSVN
jgi:hypothetical protein